MVGQVMTGQLSGTVVLLRRCELLSLRQLKRLTPTRLVCSTPLTLGAWNAVLLVAFAQPGG